MEVFGVKKYVTSTRSGIASLNGVTVINHCTYEWNTYVFKGNLKQLFCVHWDIIHGVIVLFETLQFVSVVESLLCTFARRSASFIIFLYYYSTQESFVHLRAGTPVL